MFNATYVSFAFLRYWAWFEKAIATTNETSYSVDDLDFKWLNRFKSKKIKTCLSRRTRIEVNELIFHGSHTLDSHIP